jgi:hypothetical protein
MHRLLRTAGLRFQGLGTVKPWPMPSQKDCIFYHSIDLPDGESIDGLWDIRGRFHEYLGNYPLEGKSVLDVGTAGGFLAFSAEREGASVTAFDADSAACYNLIPFAQEATLVHHTDERLVKQKNGFWYSWHKLKSRCVVIYGALSDLARIKRRYDVVVAGAVLEHLSDPISAIGIMASCAREAVIIGFTPVIDSDALQMVTANDWSRREFDYTWWTLTTGLYRRVFENLGFTTEFVPSRVLLRGRVVERTTIIAIRKH